MALFAIGDPHLSFAADKPMDVFGPAWQNHAERLREGFLGSVRPEDTVVLAGDLSWSMRLEDCGPDFRFLDSLPGQVKLIVKGNHDYWWTTGQKMERFFHQQGLETLRLLHNNCWLYGDVALCGTRGWFLDDQPRAQDEKLLRRECIRLETSLRAAGEREKIVFLHYPPIYQGYQCPPILALLRQYGVRRCYYAHLHGPACRLAFQGERDGTEFSLISADYLGFVPKKILD